MLELLAKDQFIDALWNDNVRLRVRQARPPTVRAALEHALELESYELARQQVGRPVRETRLGGTRSTRRNPDELLQECLQECRTGAENRRGVEVSRGRGGGGTTGEIKPSVQIRSASEVICWRCRQKGTVHRLRMAERGHNMTRETASSQP